MPDTFQPRPYVLSTPQSEIDDLKLRLSKTRYAKEIIPYNAGEEPAGVSFGFGAHGPPLEWIQAFAEEWGNDYDWLEREKEFNRFKHFKVDIEGLDIHFIHHRSESPDAIPLILCHGWPGSFLEFLDVIPLLTSPPSGTQAFHVVVPSQPGYAFSDAPPSFKWKMDDTARVFDKLMIGLGYDRYAAQGGDWGSITARILGSTHSDHCKAVHLNFCPVVPTGLLSLIPPRTLLNWFYWAISPLDRARTTAALGYIESGSSYYAMQHHTPRTPAYALNDSPVGLLAWIGEKMGGYLKDNEGRADATYTRRTILDTVSLYYFTQTIGTSFSPYSHNRYFVDFINDPKHFLPNFALSNFPNEIVISQERLVRTTGNLNWLKEAPQGGHFASTEEPKIFAQHLQEAFTKIWPAR